MGKFLVFTNILIGLMLFSNLSSAAVAASTPCAVEESHLKANEPKEVVKELSRIKVTPECGGASLQDCKLQGEGAVAGAWTKHRIFMGEAAILGSNDLDGLMEQVSELRQMGYCQN